MMFGAVLQLYVRFCLAFRVFVRDEDGLAAVESVLVFPIMLTLLLGTFDMGNGILTNQKTIRASQVTADLLSRNSVVDNAMVNDAIRAGELAFEPFDSDGYGVDVVSIGFDDEAAPFIEWRETRNMVPMADVLDRVEPLAEAGEGVLVVVSEFQFEPIFAGFVINAIPLREIAFARGRKGAVVGRE